MADGTEPQWFDRLGVARELGISESTVRRLHERKQLKGEVVSGKWRYSREAVEACRDVAEDIAATSEGAQAEYLRTATEMLKQSQGHVEALMRLVTEPAGAFTKAMLDQQASAAKELQELRERDRAMVAQREELESQRHEREAAQYQLLQREKRRDKLADAALPHVSGVIKSFAAKWLAGDATPAAPTPAPASTNTNEPAAPETTPPATGTPPETPAANPADFVERVKRATPQEIRILCGLLSPEQIAVAVTELAPRLDDVDRELNSKGTEGDTKA